MMIGEEKPFTLADGSIGHARLIDSQKRNYGDKKGYVVRDKRILTFAILDKLDPVWYGEDNANVIEGWARSPHAKKMKDKREIAKIIKEQAILDNLLQVDGISYGYDASGNRNIYSTYVYMRPISLSEIYGAFNGTYGTKYWTGWSGMEGDEGDQCEYYAMRGVGQGDSAKSQAGLSYTYATHTQLQDAGKFIAVDTAGQAAWQHTKSSPYPPLYLFSL